MLLGRLAIEFLNVDVNDVILLAGSKKLTAYDASYLWRAHKLDAELVTLDHALHAAAKS